MRRTSYLLLIAGAAVVLSGSAYFGMNHKTLMPSAGHTANVARLSNEKAATVEARKVKLNTIVETIHAVGSLLPNETVVVTSEIAGRIAKLPFKEGDRVEAGQTLVELDDAILRAEYDKTQSDLTLAEENQKRAVSLASRGTGTLRSRDEAVAAYRAAIANAALAKARLDKTKIAAPLTGHIGLRAVSVGAFLSPGDRIVSLSDTDIIKVDFRVPELLLTKVRPGQTINVTVDALPGQTFNGEIYVIDPIVDANGRAIRLRARIRNSDGKLSPGLFARVQIVVGRRENAVLVPESSVFAINDDQYVYRVVDGRAVQTKVGLGVRQPGWVEIRSGLGRDATVVTAGQQQIRDGSTLAISRPEKGA
ncbi:MAG: efflux RND transporter periplasmic adaptor subunit [Hyphomicrobiaceae bacterium]